jgi:hypothetical protein
MPARRRTSHQRLATQAAELAVATPQVMAHRLMRMALAGHTPSARDRREFERMGAEKMAAFQESWVAMWAETLRANQQMSLSLMNSFWFPWAAAAPASRAGTALLQRAALGVLGQGLEPVHRRAVANARRLARTRLR